VFKWFSNLFRPPPEPGLAFANNRLALHTTWFRIAAAGGKPKWLLWRASEPLGEPQFVGDYALLPVLVQFEPIPGEPLEDVPQASEARSVVAVFRFVRGNWMTDGRVVFNLTPEQVVEQLGRVGGFQKPRPTV
jgi:hypothetical protein